MKNTKHIPHLGQITGQRIIIIKYKEVAKSLRNEFFLAINLINLNLKWPLCKDEIIKLSILNEKALTKNKA